jgi:hypothetical protein
MDNVIDINSRPAPALPDDINEDVCEHCDFAKFADSGAVGECRAFPPQTGVILVPKQNQITGQVEPVIQPWTAWPNVERRSFCYTFEPKETETAH